MARFGFTLGEFFKIGWTRWFLKPAYFIASGWPRRNSRALFTECLVDVCAGASMFVPITGDRVPKEAKMMPGLQMVLDLIFKLLQDSNHGRSPSEIAHHTLNASYPHHARGGILTLPTKKSANVLLVSKWPRWAISDDFSTRRKVVRRGKLATDAK